MKPLQLGPACLVLLTAACGAEVVLGGQLPDSAGAGGLDSVGQTASIVAGNGGSVSANPAGDAGGSAAGSTGTALEACPQTNQQALDILNAHCAACHSTDGTGDPLTFITDIPRLEQTTSTLYRGEIYLIPGDPDHSLIYKRAVIVRDMPLPVPPGVKPPNFLSASEGVTLRDWITNCLY